MYISDMLQEGYRVSHIIDALETEYSEYDLWDIWLGNSMQTPSAINNKEDLVSALDFGEEELDSELDI